MVDSILSDIAVLFEGIEKILTEDLPYAKDGMACEIESDVGHTYEHLRDSAGPCS